MFDFQKLEVYKKSKFFCKAVSGLIHESKFDRTSVDQLRRASFSIMLNIAEGSSRFSRKDRRHFLVISRGSAFECAAILEYLSEKNEISIENYDFYYSQLEEISKMLYALMKKLDQQH